MIFWVCCLNFGPKISEFSVSLGFSGFSGFPEFPGFRCSGWFGVLVLVSLLFCFEFVGAWFVCLDLMLGTWV